MDDLDPELARLDADPDRIKLEALVRTLVMRKRAAKQGSARLRLPPARLCRYRLAIHTLAISWGNGSYAWLIKRI
jgi:hypothetical protein